MNFERFFTNITNRRKSSILREWGKKNMFHILNFLKKLLYYRSYIN